MNDKKLIFPFAGIAFLISSLTILYSMLKDLMFFLNYGLEGFNNFISIVGLFWFSHLLPPLFLAIILLTRTRNIWLPVGIIAQLFVLCDYIFFFFVFNDIPTLINENGYSVERIIDNSIYSFGIAILTIYTFIFSILCRNSNNQKRTRSMLIGWFIVYAVYITSFIVYIVMHTIDFSGFMLFVPYSISWIFLALWIAFPYKKQAYSNNYSYANQQSGSAYQNPYYNDFNNNQPQTYQQKSQQYNQYSQQNPQQFKQTAQYNYQQTKTCPICGAPLNDDNIFCVNCGTRCK